MPKANNGCGSGKPCVYVDRGTWIPYDEVAEMKPSYPIKTDSWKNPNSTMFVMIASFRDKLCPITLVNAFTKAKYPSRLYLGVVDQVMDDDIECLKEYCRLMQTATKAGPNDPCPYFNNIRVVKKDARESKVRIMMLYWSEYFC